MTGCKEVPRNSEAGHLLPCTMAWCHLATTPWVLTARKLSGLEVWGWGGQIKTSPHREHGRFDQ